MEKLIFKCTPESLETCFDLTDVIIYRLSRYQKTDKSFKLYPNSIAVDIALDLSLTVSSFCTSMNITNYNICIQKNKLIDFLKTSELTSNKESIVEFLNTINEYLNK